MISKLTESQIAQIQEIFPGESFSTNHELIDLYGRDWVKHIPIKALGVVFPTDSLQVQRLVKWANQNEVALVPSGGRTGLSGGAIAHQHELIVSFEKMNKILEWSSIDESVRLQPGVITENLQLAASDKGFYFPVDFASRGSSQIGGNIATNAGGIKVLRYGLMRNWVTHLEVVTGAGDLLQLNRGLIKNATGFDLRHLFIGSEGVLGFITEATLKLTRAPAEPVVFLFAIEKLSDVMSVYETYKAKTPLLAFEMFTEECLQKVLSSTTLTRPFAEAAPYYVLIEIEQTDESLLELAAELFENLLEKGQIADGVVSQSATQARDFWRLREDISEATSAFSPYKNDISVCISQVPEFLEKMDKILKKEYPQFEVCWFGHIGDGNLHVNILKPNDLSTKEFVSSCKEVNQILFEMIQDFGGSISAEHGVGLTKKPYLSFSRSPEEIEYMRAIKKVFDPKGILNPGKLIDQDRPS